MAIRRRGFRGMGFQIKGGQKGILTPGADVSISLFWSGVMDARNTRGVGFPTARSAEGTGD